MSPEFEMIYVDNLMNCLREFAELEYQRRTWLSTGGPEVSSFSEMVCQTFDDSGLGDALDTGHCPTELDEESCKALMKLRSAISKIEGDMAPEDLLSDLRMEEVRKIAQAALNLLERSRK